uniref:Transposase domain-containing protein n=1 Tax=Desmonostoc muscorum LEGE 12446 TaxID=1828758 RepID=A0A8J7D0H0_DESMC
MSPEIRSGDVLKAIEMAIPATAIEEAITNTQTEEERKRSLPAQLVVSLVIAMSLWSKDSMRDVLKNLIDGLSEGWVKVGKYWRVPCKSAITQARQRLGAGVMSQLFHQLVQPMAIGETIEAFLNGLRIVVMLNAKEIEIQNIDHLGIVAGIVDAIGLVEIINELNSIKK